MDIFHGRGSYCLRHGSWRNREDGPGRGPGGGERRGASALLKTAEQAAGEDILATDGLIAGTPVHMGSRDWRMKKFIDRVTSSLWTDERVNGRVGAVFAPGSGYGKADAGAELAMLSLLNNLAEMGYIIIPMPSTAPAAPGAIFIGGLAAGSTQRICRPWRGFRRS